MLTNEPVECIKDGLTGQCRPVRDKTAHDLIEELNKRIDNLVIGAGAVTREELEAVQQSIQALSNTISNLDNNYATDQALSDLQSSIEAQINEIISSLNGLDNNYATDQALSDLQENIENQLTAIQTKVNDLYNTYATSTDLSNLNSVMTAQINDIHPKGTYLILETGSVSPATKFTGTWTKVATNVKLPLGNSAPVISTDNETLGHYTPVKIRDRLGRAITSSTTLIGYTTSTTDTIELYSTTTAPTVSANYGVYFSNLWADLSKSDNVINGVDVWWREE